LPSAMKPVEEQPDMADNLYSRWASRYPKQGAISYQLSRGAAQLPESRSILTDS
jgi:hypothetical protein